MLIEKAQVQKASLVKIFLALKEQYQAYIKSSTKQKKRKFFPTCFIKFAKSCDRNLIRILQEKNHKPIFLMKIDTKY